MRQDWQRPFERCYFFHKSRLSVSAYWLVVAGRFVLASFVTAGALVISVVGPLLITSFVDGLLVLAISALLELVGGSMDAELVESG